MTFEGPAHGMADGEEAEELPQNGEKGELDQDDSGDVQADTFENEQFDGEDGDQFHEDEGPARGTADGEEAEELPQDGEKGELDQEDSGDEQSDTSENVQLDGEDGDQLHEGEDDGLGIFGGDPLELGLSGRSLNVRCAARDDDLLHALIQNQLFGAGSVEIPFTPQVPQQLPSYSPTGNKGIFSPEPSVMLRSPALASQSRQGSTSFDPCRSSEAMAEKWSTKRQELLDTAFKECTFTPKISSKSKELSASRKGGNIEGIWDVLSQPKHKTDGVIKEKPAPDKNAWTPYHKKVLKQDAPISMESERVEPTFKPEVNPRPRYLSRMKKDKEYEHRRTAREDCDGPSVGMHGESQFSALEIEDSVRSVKTAAPVGKPTKGRTKPASPMSESGVSFGSFEASYPALKTRQLQGKAYHRAPHVPYRLCSSASTYGYSRCHNGLSENISSKVFEQLHRELHAMKL